MSGSGRGGGIAGSLPTGVKMAAIALLIHSLMKHSRAEQGGTAVEPEGGGLGGILGRMFGKGDQGSDDRGRDYRKFRVWDRTMLLKELSYAAPQTAFYPG